MHLGQASREAATFVHPGEEHVPTEEGATAAVSAMVLDFVVDVCWSNPQCHKSVIAVLPHYSSPK